MAWWGEHNAKGNPDMDQTDNPNPRPEDDSQNFGPREPWRCDACGALQFNRDRRGNPAPGAPAPKYGDLEHQNVCWMCFDMIRAVADKPYWLKLHNEWKEKQKKRKQNNDRLKSDGDYFTP